jgi:hypothetical protein
MSPGSAPLQRPTRRTVPWLLATLTLALALAGPAYADSLGAEELAEAEAMLAAEIPEAPVEEPPEPSEPVIEPAEAPPEPSEPVIEPAEAPPEPSEPVIEPAEAPPTEPAPAPVEAPAPEPEAAPAEEPLAPVEAPAPEPAAPADEMTAEPVVDDSDVESPAPAEPGADEPAPSVVVPLNLNVDIRILSPGDDGDVTQVIDMGQLPGRGSGNPADVLGDSELGLDWTWNWNWTWDCGDASVAGLDWNWNWSWSGDCAGGMMDDEPSHEIGPFGERSRSERYPGFPDGLDLEAPNAPPELDVESGPVVTTPGFDRSPPAERDERDEARTTPAPPSGGGGLPTPALTTTFASTGAPSQSSIATAPARRPAGADPNGDPERRPAGPPAQATGLASVAGAAGGGGGGGLTVLLLAALIGALALLPPPPGGRIRAYGRTLSSLLSSSRLERPG